MQHGWWLLVSFTETFIVYSTEADGLDDEENERRSLPGPSGPTQLSIRLRTFICMIAWRVAFPRHRLRKSFFFSRWSRNMGRYPDSGRHI